MINNKKTKIIHVTSVHNHNDVRIYEKECISLSKEYNVEIINPNFEGKINKITPICLSLQVLRMERSELKRERVFIAI